MALLSVLAIAVAAQACSAEDNPVSAPSQPRFGKAVRSPEVSPEGRITFRFQAPHAEKVILVRDGQQSTPMIKDESGTWSFTTEPLPPDLYGYQFYVDGVAMADPANSLNKAMVTGGHESIAHVPGPGARPWELNDVPRGALHRHVYKSNVLSGENEYIVYTPPEYDAARDRTYPVMYLLHGVKEEAHAWSTAGRADIILDNLIARKLAVPMLVVMPLGYGFANPAERVGELFHSSTNQLALFDAVATVLLKEVVVRVERDYRAKGQGAARAMAGLSMGGAQVVYIGLNHPGQFGWIGSFSGAHIMYGGRFDAYFPHLSAKVNKQLQLLWIACGSEDFLAGPNRVLQNWLTSKDVHFSPVEIPGGHVWAVWRRNLAQFACLVFQEK